MQGSVLGGQVAGPQLLCHSGHANHRPASRDLSLYLAFPCSHVKTGGHMWRPLLRALGDGQQKGENPHQGHMKNLVSLLLALVPSMTQP